MLPNAHFATVYAKTEGRPLGRHLHHGGEPGHLDLLPWDMGLTFVEPIAKDARG